MRHSVSKLQEVRKSNREFLATALSGGRSACTLGNPRFDCLRLAAQSVQREELFRIHLPPQFIKP